MRSWLLACFAMMFAGAAVAGPCAERIHLPHSSILMLEQVPTGAPGGDPWIKRLTHPADARITVDLGIAELMPASQMDRAYMERTERGALSGAREIYRKAGARLVDHGLETTPRWAWWVTSRKSEVLYHYRRDRIGDGCALLAAITLPAAYESSGIVDRLNVSLDDLARSLVDRHGAPRLRSSEGLPWGSTALLAGILPILTMAVARLIVWRRRMSDTIPLDLAFRFGAALPSILACGAVVWSLTFTILGRGRIDNAEVLLVALTSAVWLTSWIGSRWQHVATLCVVLGPLQALNLTYWLLGWHWDERHFMWLGAGAFLSAAICALGVMKTRRDVRLQLALDEALMDALTKERP